MSSEVTSNLGTNDLHETMGAERLLVALIGPDEARRQVLATALAEHPLASVREFPYYPARLDDFQRLLEQSFDVVILDLDSDPDVAFDLVERISANNTATVMVYSEKDDPKLAVRFMRAGAREFLLLPLEEGALDEVLTRSASRLRQKYLPAEIPTEETLGDLLVLLGAKGGSGVTTVACNLAIALARESKQKTLLIDLALPIGDAALSLGIAAEFSTEDAFRNADRLDTRLLKGLLVKHKSGLFVLAAPGQVSQVETSKDAIDRLIAAARRGFDHVVVDMGSRVDVSGTTLFREASTVYLVTLTGVSELRNSNRLISQFFAAGGPKLEVVINRFEDRFLGEVNENVITKALGRPVRWKIPDDQDAAREMQYGKTGTAKTRISRLTLEMASSITGLPVPQKKKRGFGLKGFSQGMPAGTHTLSVIFTPTESANYTSAEAVVSLNVERAVPTIDWPKLKPLKCGTPLSTRQLCATASVPGTFDYSPGPGEVLEAGTHTLSVTFTPTDSANHAAAQTAVSLKVAKATPTIDWSNPDPIVFGTMLSTMQLCAKASVPGTFDYSPGPGELLPAGTHTLSVTFTPTDSANHVTAQATVSLNVASATPSIDWQTPEPIPYGTPLSTMQLCATASVPGTFEYSPAPGKVLEAGTHTLSATFTPKDSANYDTARATVLLTVLAKAIPVIAWSNPDPITYGALLSTRQLCAKPSVPGTFEYSPAPGELLGVGTHPLSATFTPTDSANYDTAEATVSLRVAKAMPSIDWPTPQPIMDDTLLSTTQLCARASVPGIFDYTPPLGVVPPAGTHTLSVIFTPTDSANYAKTKATVLLNVLAKAIPVIAWSNPGPITFGSLLSTRQLCATASVPGTFDYSPKQGAVLAAGEHALSVTFTPTDSANYAKAKATVSLKVAEATPTIDWLTPDPITHGTLLSTKQLRATASVPGRFDYSPAPGVILPAGMQTLSVTFTPADSANYTAAETNVPLNVERAVPAIDWPTPRPIQCGTLLSTKQLCAAASVPGRFDYTPTPGEALPAGTHSLSVTFSPSDSANYTAAKAVVSLSVERATPTVDWSIPEPITFRTLLSAKQLCATASVPGTLAYSPASGKLLPAGTHTLSVTFTPADSANYTTAETTVSLNVAMATLSIDWPTPEPIQCGTRLTTTQLCAKASDPGTFDYSPASGVILPAGTHTLSVTFTPTDSANYATVQATVQLNVAKATLAVAWSNPDPVTFGTLLSTKQCCATALVPGRFDYSPALGEELPAGTHTLSVIFTPTNSANYTTTQATVSLTVAKATPTIEWPTPKPMTSDAILSARQLCATSSIPGTFDYSLAPGEALAAGTHTLSVTFTPTNSANYTTTQTTVTLEVSKVAPSIDWPAPKPIKYGTPLSAAQLRAAAWIPGTCVYSPAEGEVLPEGTHTLSVTFIPTDSENYATVQATVSLDVVARITPLISWPKPNSITYGTLLSPKQLCATAAIPGTFDYSQAPGELLGAGANTLSVIFTPTDSANYATTQATVSLNVTKATPSIEWSNPDSIPYGTQLSSTQLCATASVSGTFEYSPAPGELLPRGIHTLSVIFFPTDNANYAKAKIAVLLNVAMATPSIEWSNPEPITVGTPLSTTQLCATASVPGMLDYSPAPGMALMPGTHTLSVSFTPSDTQKYAATQATVQLEVVNLRDHFRWVRIAAAIIACSILLLLIYVKPQFISETKSMVKQAIDRVFPEQTQPVVTAPPPSPVAVPEGIATKLLIHKTKPVYPPSAKRASVSGTVELDAIISTTGIIEELHVIKGPTMLQQAAVDAVRTWRYKSYKLNNEPTEFETTIKVNFSLGR